MQSFPEQETALTIPGPAGDLEVRVAAAAEGTLTAYNFTAIVCHPHPQHGGTMDNKVVTTLARSYRKLGCNTVRFNFRGVGRSAGHFGHGDGEQEDALAVCRYASAQHPGGGLLLAGFSFGGGVAMRVVRQLTAVRHLALVAPSLRHFPADGMGTFHCPTLVLQGEQDEVLDAGDVYRWVDDLQGVVKLVRVADTGHFFHGKLVALADYLRADLCDWAARSGRYPA
jgi:hypothetical protein